MSVSNADISAFAVPGRSAYANLSDILVTHTLADRRYGILQYKWGFPTTLTEKDKETSSGCCMPSLYLIK